MSHFQQLCPIVLQKQPINFIRTAQKQKIILYLHQSMVPKSIPLCAQGGRFISLDSEESCFWGAR